MVAGNGMSGREIGTCWHPGRKLRWRVFGTHLRARSPHLGVGNAALFPPLSRR